MSQTERGRERERGANVSRGRGCTGATSKYGWGKLALIKLYTVAMETMAKIKKAPGEEVQKTCARVCVCQVDKRVILRMDLVFHLVYVQNPVLITRCICARVSVFEIGGMLMNP